MSSNSNIDICVYAWDGVDIEGLSCLYDLRKADRSYYYKGEAIISPYYSEELIVNMEFKGYLPTEIRPDTINAQGWERNPNKYFSQLLDKHPEYFSAKNANLITIDKKVPIVDDTFLDFFPEYSSV